MYNASATFHAEAGKDSPISSLILKFDDGTVFTREDIGAEVGLSVMESVCLENEFSIGCCTASQLTAQILNHNRLLDEFDYSQEFKAFLGVRTSYESTETINANCYMRIDDISYTGHSEMPYLMVDDIAYAIQPSFAPIGMVYYAGVLYMFGANGECEDWTGLAYSLNDFMKAKVIARSGHGYLINELTVIDYYNTNTLQTSMYEYVPLGVFMAERPEKKRISVIALTALDRMNKFDADATAWWDSIEWGATLTHKDILISMCSRLGVPLATEEYTNAGLIYATAPAAIVESTYREILSMLAESASSNARINRDGELELVLWNDIATTLLATDYISMDIAEYTVEQIDKLQVSASKDDIGVVIEQDPDSVNGYRINDNIFLYGLEEQAITHKAAPIAETLFDIFSYRPAIVSGYRDWSIQAGDIVKVILNDVIYSVPIFSQTIVYRGSGVRITGESSGSEKRPTMSVVNRQTFAANKKVHDVSVTVDELRSTISQMSVDTTTNFSSIQQTVDEIAAQISALNKSSSLTMTSESIEVLFESLQSKLETLGEDMTTLKSSVTIDSNGILLQASNADIKLRISKDVMYFFSGTEDSYDLSNAFAYFSAGSLSVKNINVQSSIQIGDTTQFRWEIRSNGHLTLVRI